MPVVMINGGEARGIEEVVARVILGQTAPKSYLKTYVPEANQGHGLIEWTDDLAQAIRFKDVAEAWSTWHKVPINHPVRTWDGAPNKPLTAFNVTFEDVAEQGGGNVPG